MAKLENCINYRREEMDSGNIPSNKLHAEIYLLAYKQALLDLCADIEEHKMTKAYQVNGHAFNVIEEVDEKLESGDYE